MSNLPVVLITGGLTGIGRAAAVAFAKKGAKVVVAGRRDEAGKALVKELRSFGSEAEFINADVRKENDVRALVDKSVARFGRLDVAVNNAGTEGQVGPITEQTAESYDRFDGLVANAGISKSATIEDTTVADFDSLFAVNVRAPFFLVQQLLPIMSAGSSIVLVSSLAARAVVGTIPAYAATKGAIDTLVKHFAAMLGARGI